MKHFYVIFNLSILMLLCLNDVSLPRADILMSREAPKVVDLFDLRQVHLKFLSFYDKPTEYFYS